MTKTNMEQIIKGLGDPFRLKLLERIKNGPGETNSPISKTNPNAICPLDLRAGFPTMTKERLFYHLQLLVSADLVHKIREGRYTYYSINREGFESIIEWSKGIRD
ncbi:ArsR/SmtB family transcription factor [Oenococcus sicerae]|uniref:ArsR/SmtB family transcription factor n=1 Tax=Oenococcus sicerae TaxID=2203724 RepID=UPI0010B109ED|nr:hypothetical protein OAL24_01628 [Oenococcus sicerae]